MEEDSSESPAQGIIVTGTASDYILFTSQLWRVGPPTAIKISHTNRLFALFKTAQSNVRRFSVTALAALFFIG